MLGKNKKGEVPTSAPEEEETPGEAKHIEELGDGTPQVDRVEVPVCMSQEQINTLVIEMHMMMRQLLINTEKQ